MKYVVGLVLMVMACVCLSAGPTQAQGTREARLLVTVVDSTGAVLPGAKVTVVGLDEATRKTAVPVGTSSDKGIATFEHLVVGRYSVSGEFEGFDIGLLKDLRLKGGDNKHVLVLPLKKFSEEVTVGRDRQMVAADRGQTFGSALTREQVEALSDDPDEMSRQLQDMAGGRGTIRVDSFEGQQLPPKAQIKAVHITRDTFAAENHYAGGMFIDIITQPGIGPLRGQANFNLYNNALDGENILIPRQGPAGTLGGTANVSGSLIKNKSSFSLSLNRSHAYLTPNLYAETLQGKVAQSANLRRPTDTTYVTGLFDYAITKDQTIRLTYSGMQQSIKNQGVGAYDFPERAYSTSNHSQTVRLQEAGPIGRRFFINTRMYLGVSDMSSESMFEARTIVVNDTYTRGGAQKSGGRHSRSFYVQSDLDYVRGINSFRAGVEASVYRYRSNDNSNYLGTYTFASLDMLTAQLPRTYTQRIGDPNIAYWNDQFAVYLQDDVRVRKNLTLSPGMRMEIQSLVSGGLNLAPRFGVTWAPFKSGKTTVRGSWGIFYDWFGTGIYEQTLRVDGQRMQQVNLINTLETPLAFPDPGPVVGLPSDRYLLGPGVQLPRNMRASAGIEQQLGKKVRVSATYENVRSDRQLAGINLNPPHDGVRPDPEFVNVFETTPLGEARSHNLNASLNVSLSPTSPMAGMAGPRWSWKRGLGVYVNYELSRATNNTDGAFSVPASGTLATEWGPAGGDVRHWGNVGFYTNALKSLNVSLSMSANSGSAYTMRLAQDANGDGLFNDRPAGVGRGTLRTAPQFYSSAYLTYSIGLGKRTVAMPPGLTFSSGPMGSISVGTSAAQATPRYRLSLRASINNITNHANYGGYSGIIGSPFFMQPTVVEGVRRITFSVGFSF